MALPGRPTTFVHACCPLGLVAVLLCLGVVLATAQEAPADGPSREPEARETVGRLIRVAAPLDGSSERRIRQAVSTFIDDATRQGRWPTIIFEFAPGTNDFGKALDFARYLASPQLNGATSVAYVPETITGHTVLPILACDQIVMHPDAMLGDAGAQEQTISPTLLNGYTEIARSRRTVPVDLAVGLVNRAAEVLEVETETGREFVLSDDLDELAEQKVVVSSEVLKPAGKPALFSGREGRELGFVTLLAEDRQALARALGLSRDAVEEDPALGRDWRAIRVNLQGAVTARSAEQVRRVIEDQIRRQDVNFICLWIDSPGGSPVDSLSLANYLAELDSSHYRTVAFVSHEAGGDAAFAAVACDHLVIESDATLGGWTGTPIPADEVSDYTTPLREIAQRKFRDPALIAALANPDLAVFRYTRQDDGRVEYLSQAEFDELPEPELWQQGQRITTPGETLTLSAAAALEVGLARHVVDGFAEFKDLYGLTDDPALVEPGWADLLASILRYPGVASILLTIGFVALYFEFQSPGIGVGAFVSCLAFVLYFWGNYLGGTVEWLEILLFTLGVVFIGVEIFVLPGFGIFGLGGGAMVLLALVLAGQSFLVPRDFSQLRELRGSLFVVTMGVFGFLLASMFIRRFLPHTPVLNRMLLAPLTGDELAQLTQRESLAHYESLLGARGKAVTQIAPAGKARFGEQLVDVISQGELIARDTPVEVIEARANRVVVRAASG